MSDLQSRLDALAALEVFKDTAVRVKCESQSIKGWCYEGKLFPQGDVCPNCHGVGFTGSTDLAVWKEAVVATGWYVWSESLTPSPQKSDRWGLSISRNLLTTTASGRGRTELEALVSALEQSLGGEAWLN